MADVTMNSATIPDVTPAVEDLLLAWDMSAGANGEFTISALQTLMSAVFATLAGANTFTANQTIAKVDPTIQLTPTTGKGAVSIASADAGASWGGNVIIGRNTNASTSASGFLGYVNKGGVSYYVWPDNNGGILRIHTALPTSANDQAGSVIGLQGSSLDQKDVLGNGATIEQVLAFVAQGAAAVRAFQYKGQSLPNEDGDLVDVPGAFPGETFEGLITDYAGRYGMDRDETHPNGKSLNTINALGDLLRAVDWLIGEVKALKESGPNG